MINSADEARDFAKQVFLSRHASQGGWFDLMWDTFAARPDLLTAPPNVQAAGLDITGPGGAAAQEMAKDIATLFETLMTRFPLIEHELLVRLEGNAAKHGKSRTASRLLRKAVEQNISDREAFFVWTAKADEIGVRPSRVSRPELEQSVLPQLGHFDVCVHLRAVYVKKDNKLRQVDLDERLYRILVLLLRYKGEHVGVEQLYVKAWNLSRPNPSVATPEELLRPAVSELRGGLEAISGKFEIYKNASGYACRGAFASCVILHAHQEKDFRILQNVSEL